MSPKQLTGSYKPCYKSISGIVFNHHSYKTARKFALTAMRDFGLGKRSLEERIQEEGIALVEQMKSEGGKPFDPNQWLGPAVSNIICSINFGKRYAKLRLLILFSNKTHDLFYMKTPVFCTSCRSMGHKTPSRTFILTL